MPTGTGSQTITTARLLMLSALVTLGLGYLLTSDSSFTPAHAFSSGPPAGYTGAPSEVPEACAECHVPPDSGTGHITITAPQTYIPGQTYPITVTHSNLDVTRKRWGFELTVLDTSDEKAGQLQSLDGTTQVLNNAGPSGSRQYIEHTAAGTYINQLNTASWTFNWTAPSTDIGFVTFYAAGNQANNDGNTSGDYIYKTFVAVAPASSSPDYALTITPSSRNAIPGGSGQYSVTVTPLAGFTGVVNLATGSLQSGVTASFSPTTLNINDATAKTTTLTVNTTLATPLGLESIDVNAQSGTILHSSPITLNVVSPTSADLSITNTASPNPGQVGVGLSYRIIATNNGPATATNVVVSDTLPAGVTFNSDSATQGVCSGNASVACSLGTLTSGASAIVTISVTPTAQGQLVDTATVSATESDFDATNNSATATTTIQAPAASPSMTDPNLTVTTLVSGLDQPTSMAFIGPNDFLVTEKPTGKVRRVVNGVLQSTPLDLAVNNASERGLLGIVLHPNFSQNGYVYLYWTESTSGVDSANIDDVPLLGNRVDRYHWNGTTLTFDRNVIKLRSLQQDAGQSSRGNHNGGVVRFGPDTKLYIIIGDNGRRGFLQNLPTGGPVPDDQFGGPEPDNAHLTGVILRLNDDGSTPSDNPFFNAATALTGEAAANLKKVFAYGVRNGFGMAFDPLTGNLWTQENGDDAFDEMNRVTPGFDGGWVQVIGPINRIAEYKNIESTYGAGNLQQLRWSPSNIAATPQEALSKLFMVPGSQYVDPEFSWKYALAPAGIGFVKGRGLGPQFEGDLFVGASRTTLLNGYLFRFKFNSDRQHFAFTDPRLNDRVADNADKFDQTESESLIIGKDFGVATDIETGPNGNVFVVSLSNGAIYEIKPKPAQVFVATLTGAQETPANSSTGTGSATLVLSPDELSAHISLNFSGLTAPQNAAHIHGPAAAGVSGAVLFPLPLGQINDFEIDLSPGQSQDLKNGLWYINVHSNTFPSGEIRGQFGSPASASSIQVGATKYVVGEGEARVNVDVTRIGSNAAAATINYSATDSGSPVPCGVLNGAASSRCDYGTTVGTLAFSSGESTKTISIPIIDDNYVEGPETFTITLSGGNGANVGPPGSAVVTIIDNDLVNGPNPILTTSFFVRQHYLDFLSREPEVGEPWSAILNNCSDVNNNPSCDRLTVSAAFLGSPEFKLKGFFVYRFYKLAFNRLPDYSEIVSDMSSVTGQTPQEVFDRKGVFTNTFVQRPEFVSTYGGLTNTQFVAALMVVYSLNQITTPDPGAPDGTNKVTLTTADLTAGLNGGTLTRAQAVRAIADSDQVANLEFNKAFVAMQYYGYLRRTPESAGYNAWLTYLNANPTDFRTMVNGFVNSVEYKLRFAP